MRATSPTTKRSSRTSPTTRTSASARRSMIRASTLSGYIGALGARQALAQGVLNLLRTDQGGLLLPAALPPVSGALSQRRVDAVDRLGAGAQFRIAQRVQRQFYGVK